MAKSIFMVDPFEVLTGNLGSKQDLRYREHDNKAYEAPNGIARAKNYRTRYVGVRRADGTTYFMVKKKSTANLNNTTRMTMALLGVVAAMKSSLRSLHANDWAKLMQAYAYQVEHGIQVPDTFDKWVNEIFRTMLRYKQDSYTFNQASISVTIYNPYADSTSALEINQKVWFKFMDVLGQGILTDEAMTIDGRKFFIIGGTEWEDLLNPSTTKNVNMRLQYSSGGISIPSAGAAPLFNGLPIYEEGTSVAVVGEDAVNDGDIYTTIQPTA